MSSVDALRYAENWLIVLSAFFLAVGFLKGFKDKTTSTITVWGKIALSGCLLTLAFSVVLSSIKHKLETREELLKSQQEEAKRREFQNLASKIKRLDDSIKDVTLECWIRFPAEKNLDLEFTQLKSFFESIDNAAKKIEANEKKMLGASPDRANGYVSLWDGNFDIREGTLPSAREVAIPLNSPLIRKSPNTVARLLFSEIGFWVDFYIDHLDPRGYLSKTDWHNQLAFYSNGSSMLAKRPDLELRLNDSAASVESKCDLLYRGAQNITIHCKGRAVQSSKSTISEIPDLLGTQMFLRWRLGKEFQDQGSDGVLEELRGSQNETRILIIDGDTLLDYSVLSISSQSFGFDTLNRYPTGPGYFSIDLPETMRDLSQYVPRYGEQQLLQDSK